MNLQFISIGNHNGMSVAYFLDNATRTVYMFRVVDMTAQQPVAPTPPADRVNVPFVLPVEAVQVPAQPSPQTPVNLPDKPRSIMPPGVADMFREGNEFKMGG